MVALGNAIVLTLLTYWLNNQPLFTGEDLEKHTWIAWIKEKLGVADHSLLNDVIFVNIGYDKQLVVAKDSAGMEVGNIDITDRSKLLQFFQMLSSTSTYKYIFLDIRFEKRYKVPGIDDKLFALIRTMKNIVVANHSDIEIADSSLLPQTALGDFKSTIFNTSFIRYKYSYEGKPTMPLYAYRELTHKDINGHVLFYTCDGELCYNSLFLKFPVTTFDEFDENGDKQYYNLGVDLLESSSKEDIATLVKDKYIVIGDMIEDVHDTYSGKMPGSVITYYAFQALMHGEHIVSCILLFSFALLYFIISIFLFSHYSLLELIPRVRRSESKLLHFIASLVEYTVILTIIAVLLNLFGNISVSILLPSLYFSIQKNIIRYKRFSL